MNKNNVPNVPEDIPKEERILNSSIQLPAKAIIGPLVLLGGSFGLVYGLIKSFRTIPLSLKPKKLFFSCLLNTTLNQTLKYANAAGGLGIVYCITRKTINILLDDKIQKMTNNIKKQFIYGLGTGMIYKCARGLGPSILSGLIIGNCCAGLAYFNSNKYKH